jgi:HD superfamily phosphodiesterase
MTLPINYLNRCVYHFTTIDHLRSILEHGLLSRTQLHARAIPVTSLGWQTSQNHRSNTVILAEPGKTPDDYVPLYFSKLSPMLLTILNNKTVDEQDMIHFEFPIQVMEKYPSVFTSAAILPDASPDFYTRADELDWLHWDLIDSLAWRLPDHKLRLVRMAELLILYELPVASARSIIVWNEAVAQRVNQVIHQEYHLQIPVRMDAECYFIDPDEPLQTPAVMGPRLIFEIYQSTLTRIGEKVNRVKSSYRFTSLDDLKDKLRQDLAALPETEELIGLETDNRAHVEDVGAHTRRVVTEVFKTPEYQQLDAHLQTVLEVAAYLHDIGKGPRSRWIKHGGRQQIDFNHPVKALPLVERILTEEVARVASADARLICMLVAYHDIIGGVLFSGRRKEELLNIINNLQEYDLLSSLSKADAIAINPAWGEPAHRIRLREEIIKEQPFPKNLYNTNS